MMQTEFLSFIRLFHFVGLINCSYPTSAAVADADDYDLDMLKALRKVNVDNNSVGWYQSTFLGSYCTKDTILHQFEYQESLPNR